MTPRPCPPFRAEHVGSFLRPSPLLDARERRERGEISAAALRAVEDAAIRDIVRAQESWGLRAVTDGEFRRASFHVDFLEQLDGVEVRSGLPVRFQGAAGEVDFAPPVMHVTGRLRHVKPIRVADFQFLRSTARATPKVALPSPTMLHFHGGRAAISRAAYPDLEAFYEDVAGCYRDEIASLARAGCTYLQFDDTNLASVCDDEMRALVRARGEDPAELPQRYVRLINTAIADRPPGMTVAVHLGRGNFRSAGRAAGGYAPIAEALFGELAVDAYFLEYDEARSGDFAPLRFVPQDKVVVLGLVTTKSPQLESKDALKRRIEQAARYVPLERLCLSPQCGFASTVHGNRLTAADQAAKMRLVVETANEVWGGT